MPRLRRRSFTEPEETRTFTHGDLRIITLDEVIVGHYELEPGWKWSNDIKPIVGTPFCQHHHMGYALQGHLHVLLKDGTTNDVRGGRRVRSAWPRRVGGGRKMNLGIEFSGSRTFAIPPSAIGGGIVATLLFTDIVGSTATLARVGDAAWREMLLAHNAAMRAELERLSRARAQDDRRRFPGVRSTALRALSVAGRRWWRRRARSGLEVRVGCHTGEVELVENDAHGVAVHAAGA